MKEYEGAVLFVDILGISALTTSSVSIVEEIDFRALNPCSKKSGGNQFFCALLLSKFRENLRKCKTTNLKIAQLSDCAFLWSRNESVVVDAAKTLFERNAESGVFARGGMTYGQIIEPNKTNKRMGQFICGNAVTRAAQLEGSGKGSRIFIDREIGGRQIQGTSPKAFESLAILSDYRMIDEFLWFSCPDSSELRAEKIERLKNLIMLRIRFQHAPTFRWNAASKHGLVHLGATIERLVAASRQLCDELELNLPQNTWYTSEQIQNLYEVTWHSESEYHEKCRVFKEHWSNAI
ncbi:MULTISPECIES: hypothetical protein [Pacificibacter]|uniref:hypothetical protein n=1 Tax=Pacificibacter TaxID=1042323 RepID=UPI001C099863|nr:MULTISPECIES: hypothetical protein [Pacificibacter]MBU2937009.1 hypothetical protein [Pacificibacter marinus]MDO6617185.1 hypothetical protein [Pacificibacter sp. 1_MG-2023]